MIALPLILVAQNDNDFMKVVFGVIFAAIWAASAAASAWSKKKQEERRRKVQEELERAARTAPNWGDIASEPPRPPTPPSRRAPSMDAPHEPPRVPTPPSRRAPPPAPPRTPQQRLEKRKAKQPPKVPRAPKPPPVPSMPAPEEAVPGDMMTKSWADSSAGAYATTTARTARTATLAGARKPPPVGVDAKAIRSWLRPGTLRRQFILTELLQAPVAMRPPPDAAPDGRPGR